MEIRLQNTLTGKKEIFKAIHQDGAAMYNCGPTVYFFAHIGNMRAYVFADILKRVLKFSGLSVKQVINITDVGHLTSDSDTGRDKIEEEARREGKTAAEITGFYENAFRLDLANLNIDTSGTVFPKASEHIKDQIDLVKILEEKGYAYKTSDGIYFDTSKFTDYGKLGHINLERQKEGARVEANSEKRNPSDFALWKFSPPAGSGQPSRLQEWDSPWGIGFPGWHIECSAMSRKYLGQPFDIHTGGMDHIPIHHNNEIAQSEAAYGVPLANYWMHSEFLSVEGEKMSKSLGNIFTVSNLKERKIHPLAFRLWLLSGHYRSPMNFTWEAVSGAHKTLEKLVFEFENLPDGEIDEEVINKFKEFVSDDLDIPKALVLLHDSFAAKKSKKTIQKMDEVLGIKIAELSQEIKEIPTKIFIIKEDRDAARTKKDWQKSDDLRGLIEQEGYSLEDLPTQSSRGSETVIRKKLSTLIS